MAAAAEQGPFSFPARIWDQEQTRQMLQDRDIRNLLRLARQHGVSQQRIGSATGIAQSRISDIMTGGRQVTSLQIFEMIADGFAMPDDARVLLGLAPKQTR
ncbi:MAG: helix-turn-helix domain-containing protein [Streptosporangiaceae bacterium]